MNVRFSLFLAPLIASSLLGRAESLPSIETNRISVAPAPEVAWWAGVIDQGFQMPLTNGYEADMSGDTYGNQGQPLLLSSQGDVIWSDDPIAIHLTTAGLTVAAQGGRVSRSKHGGSLREAYLAASRAHFPPTGKMPDELLFGAPQYNTWIELMYDQNQNDVIKYAKGIVEHGFPPGALMIDDNWQQNYGQWDFRKNKFPDAKAMMESLHAKGFKVMLWVCPFVNTNCDCYPELAGKYLLLRDSAGAVAMIKWWNGESALLDFTNPKALTWFCSQLEYLRTTYGVDGFKFDAGDSSFYKATVSRACVTPNAQSELYGSIGLQYPLNEFRAMWKMGGQPLAERLRDKEHSWNDLRKLVPNMLLEGLMGYPFSCPDMIGGGEYKSFQDASTIDQELLVRSAQCHALMPMMQFSVAPWRVLDQEHLNAVLKAVHLRAEHKDYILKLARQSALTGEPVVRSMEYLYPHHGYEHVNDEFLLGDQLLVAPVVEKGVGQRSVLLPPGVWTGFDGKRYQGPDEIHLSVPYDELCYFKKTGELQSSR